MRSSCTCPPADVDSRTLVRDPKCPEHGLDTLQLPELRRFVYDDEIEVYAEDQAAADKLHQRMVDDRPKTHDLP